MGNIKILRGSFDTNIVVVLVVLIAGTIGGSYYMLTILFPTRSLWPKNL